MFQRKMVTGVSEAAGRGLVSMRYVMILIPQTVTNKTTITNYNEQLITITK